MTSVSTQTSSKPPASLRVLVVDDNLNAGRALAAFFNRKGHEVRAFGTGREALNIAPQFAPELVLLDVDVPDGSGTDLGAQLRLNQGAYASLIAALSDSDSFYSRRRCAEVGFDYYLAKPVAANEYDYLLSAADKKSHITETFFNRKREHDAAFYSFVIAQLAFGDLILDFAKKHSDAASMQRSFERANHIGDMATIWLGRATSLSSDQMTRLFAMIGALRRRLAEMRESTGL